MLAKLTWLVVWSSEILSNGEFWIEFAEKKSFLKMHKPTLLSHSLLASLNFQHCETLFLLFIETLCKTLYFTVQCVLLRHSVKNFGFVAKYRFSKLSKIEFCTKMSIQNRYFSWKWKLWIYRFWSITNLRKQTLLNIWS